MSTQRDQLPLSTASGCLGPARGLRVQSGRKQRVAEAEEEGQREEEARNHSREGFRGARKTHLLPHPRVRAHAHKYVHIHMQRTQHAGVYTCACMCTHNAHTGVHMHVHTCTHECMQAHTCTHSTHACIYVKTRARTQAYSSVYT